VVKLYSTSEAYYSQTHGARYYAPLFSEGSYPSLVEFHGSMHSYLCLSNLSDAVGRLFGGVVLEGGHSLRADHKLEIDLLFAALCEHTCRTHELLATYLGFLMFRVQDSERVDAARASLSDPYAVVLRSAEAAFGDIRDPRLDPTLIPAIMGCAIAALGLPFPDDVASFEYLPRCAEFLVQNSPDRRLDKLLQQIKPAWEPGSVMANLEDLDEEEVQAGMFAALRSVCPEIEFATHAERPTRFREWASALVEDGEKYSYEFMASLRVSPHPADTAIQRLSGCVEIPGLMPEDPCDLSLRSSGYAQGSPDELSAVAQACGEQGATAFCHIFASIERNETNLFCFALDSEGHHAAVPFGTSVPLDALVRLLAQVAPRHLVLKIDERWGAQAAGLLATTGHPVFRLLHDTSPANMHRLVRSAAEDQTVSIAIHYLGGGPGYAVCAYLDKERDVVLAPATELGAELLYRELHELDGVTILKSEESIPEWLPVDAETLKKTLSTTYVEGPGRFDEAKDRDHLLRGLYI
jgi:hypothetical protein